MNPRLLRPTQGGFSSPDADARAYLAAVRIADGSNLEPAVAKAISDFVIGCKADGIWSAIKASCLLMGARTLSGALTPLVGTAPTNNNFVSGDYNRKTGLIGNESNKYLDSNRANDADGQDDVHQAIYVGELGGDAAGSAVRAMIGAGTTGQTAIRARRSDNFVPFSGRNSLVNSLSGALATGFFGLRRNSGLNFQVLAPSLSATQNFNRASEAPDNANVGVFALNTTSSVGSYTGQRLAFYSIGSSLDLLLLRSRVNALYAAIGAAIP
jgi:hypothetical protein